MSIEAMKQALEALEKLWNIIDDIDTYGDMAKDDGKLYRSLVERRQRQRFETTGISTDGYELSGGAITALRTAIEQAEKQEPVAWMKEGWGPDCGPYIEFYRDDEMGWRDRKEWTALYTTPPAQEFVCSTGLCHFTLTQTNVGIGERGVEAYEEAKKRGWVGLSDERLMEMPQQPPAAHRE